MHSRPVFTDVSGRRRRVMRRIGGVAAVVLAICLGAVLVAMAGGPEAPLTRWAAGLPPAAAGGHGRAAVRGIDAGHSAASRTAGGPTPTVSPAFLAAPSPSAGSTPRPTASRSATGRPTASGSATGSATASPAPTNRAGHTPPGQTRSPGPPHGT